MGFATSFRQNIAEHAPPIAAAKAKKHIILEKPMAMNIADCRAIVDAAVCADDISRERRVFLSPDKSLVDRRLIRREEWYG